MKLIEGFFGWLFITAFCVSMGMEISLASIIGIIVVVTIGYIDRITYTCPARKEELNRKEKDES